MATHRISYLTSIGKDPNESYSIQQLSHFSGIPARILAEVQRRGEGAAISNPQSVRIKGTFQKDPNMTRFPRSARLSPRQWGVARVFSFLDKGRTYYTADADLAREAEALQRRRA